MILQLMKTKVVDFLINAGAHFDEGGTVAKNCNACGKEDPDNTLRCIGCLAIHYCCEECQRSDWTNRKAQCRDIKAMRDKYKGSKIREEIAWGIAMEEQAKNEKKEPSTWCEELEERFQKFQMEDQVKNEREGFYTGEANE